jgi:CubicO group peptidase (beta-lactamase class C family)
VVHGGRLVYEQYAPGVTADSILPSFSVSKSFTSTVIGLLVGRGRLRLDDRAPIPDWSARTDPRRAITLRNLLNMSSGLQWNEDYFNGQSDVVQMVVSGDESRYAIAKPLAVPPGTRWHYSTGDAAVLGRIIADTARVSGNRYRAYLHRQLFDPLGIKPVDLGFDAAGRWRAGWWTNTTTRNFAKLGLLYLRDGVWENKRFLSSKWVDFVRTPSPAYSGYGGQFWLNSDGSFEMIGLFGQSVHIIPDLDLIIAVNNGTGDFPMLQAFRNARPPSCDHPPPTRDDAASGSAATRPALTTSTSSTSTTSTSASVSCAPKTVFVRQSSTCTATVTETSGRTTPTGSVDFTSSPGPGTFSSGGSCTLSLAATAGTASCPVSYIPSRGGSPPERTDTLTASYGGDSTHTPSSATTTATVMLVTQLASGSFVIGDRNAAVGNPVTLWGAQWSQRNSLSGGPAPASFQGFASHTLNLPRCGDTWTTDSSISSKPPGLVPEYMTVIASSAISRSGPTISGNIPEVVVVETNPGSPPDPGHPGTATVVAVVCHS